MSPGAGIHRRSVLIADDHPLVAHGIERVLAGDEFDVVAACHSGAETLAVARRLRPELVLLDVRLGDMNGADVCRGLGDQVPGAKVVVLTAFGDTDNLRRCLESGAAGVLLKGTLDLDLTAALHDVARGRMVIDPGIARALETASGILAPDGRTVPPLRPRELEVLRLMAAGTTTRDIAAELELSLNTIRTYTQSLMTKLNAHTRVQAVVFAQQMQLI
ncbi:MULTISPECIES: response regulator [Pseudonocardia]|uniref:Response regulator protein VraR n=2 Tax=Pseudonocardia TaxID=1847 RepID=A0A1Y2MJZ0_PSEAH|nr:MULTISPECIES: response regulator transcription factor [Pseudonocardia]OSY35482.1 Response regulator protein VraR [Pseudonocardia autotrophica]TDN76958.1 LuxR family two component transcriptional regulator [Pseudonocardia autotrophica]BBG00962.1 DNA-binding response regulator [Pseudonocardia autotrophica]GEC29161.1 DNA-binding response regulator [Pseudonocardia saturnea]